MAKNLLVFALALSSLIACSVHSSEASAAGPSRTTSAWETPVKPDALLETCSTNFIDAYKRVIIEIKTIAVYAKAGEQPPNLVAAVKACDKIEKAFPAHSCQVGTQTASTADFAEACTSIRELANSLNIQIPADVPPPTTAQLTDATPVSVLAPSGLSLKVQSADDFRRALTQSKLYYFIGGKIYDFASSILVNSDVRCTLALDDKESNVSNVVVGATFKTSLIVEEVKHDHFYTRLSVEGADWTVDCAKHVYGSDAGGTGITWGELKNAFGSHATFSYSL